MQTFKPATLLKRDSRCFLHNLKKIFKNSYFEEHLWTAVSEGFFFYVVFLLEQINKNKTKNTILKLN